MRQNLNAFTGLRGISCLAVATSHFTGSQSWNDAGPQAVYFFFVLSGYLLTKHALDEIQSSPDKAPKSYLGFLLVKYLIKRILRVYPAFFVCGLAYKSLCYAQRSENELIRTTCVEWKLYDWDWLLKLAPTLTHFWTIYVEMVFFVIMLPLILIVASALNIFDHKYLRYRPIKLVVIFYLLVTTYMIWVNYQIGYMLNPSFSRDEFYKHMPVFWYGCVGGIISHYLSYYKIHISMNARYKVIIAEIVTYLILFRIYLGNKNIGKFMLGIEGEVWWQSQTLHAPFYSLLLIVLEIVGSKCSMGEFLSLSKVVFIGEISYSVYLSHLICIRIILAYTKWDNFESLSTALVLSNIFGYILYKFVESPSVRAGHKIVKYLERLHKNNFLPLVES
jgi:peptidoglycan/LPS O-acetylase OafA/YrhL